jgi:hypothetical protein
LIFVQNIRLFKSGRKYPSLPAICGFAGGLVFSPVFFSACGNDFHAGLLFDQFAR